MSYEMLVGLEVSNDEIYNEYRKAMMPILLKFGGGFRYDFKIAEVLKKETENNINRVFTIYFPDEKTRDQFFVDAEYVVAREKFFEKSVKTTTMIAGYVR